MMVELVVEEFMEWLPLTLGTAAAAFCLARFLTRNHSPMQCSRLCLWVGWVMDSLFRCHRSYVRSRRPFRIILMRHGESEGNVNKCIFSSTPDHAQKLTERGKCQAAVAGSELKKLVGDESVYFIVSPYTRTRMTYEIVRAQLGERQLFMKEDPRLRELDFGNFQDSAAMQGTMETRKAYGRFWFRFMNGESGADVYDRATAFWESVFRSMDHTTGTRFENYVIITHGLMMRLILMRYFQWTVEFFERVWNPRNCETWVMERDERGTYRVVTDLLDRPPPPPAATVTSVAEDPNGRGTKVTPRCRGGTEQTATAAGWGSCGDDGGSGGGRGRGRDGEGGSGGGEEEREQKRRRPSDASTSGEAATAGGSGENERSSRCPIFSLDAPPPCPRPPEGEEAEDEAAAAVHTANVEPGERTGDDGGCGCVGDAGEGAMQDSRGQDRALLEQAGHGDGATSCRGASTLDSVSPEAGRKDRKNRLLYGASFAVGEEGCRRDEDL